MSYEDDLDRVLNEVKTMLIAKNHDYGPKNLLRHGETGIIVRVSDKLSRLEHIVSQHLVQDEPPEKTWGDIAGYALQAILMRQGKLGEADPKLEDIHLLKRFDDLFSGKDKIEFSDREISIIAYCCSYAEEPCGLPGHALMLVVEKLYRMISEKA